MKLQLHNTDDLLFELRKLGMAGDVLHIGAHPDDEEPGLMAYVARNQTNEIVYWSASRGEGGQNRIGSESQEALGVFRTWESEDARRVDGGQSAYGPFYDYGYSKNGGEAFSKWERDDLIREIVRAIRFNQPQVVVSRWRGDESDGHGHHVAVGKATIAAVAAAADPRQFEELRVQCPPAWKPQKFYQAMAPDYQPGETVKVGVPVPDWDEAQDIWRLNTGEFDPQLNMSYQEVGWRAINKHRSQGISFVPQAGDYFAYFRLLESEVGTDRIELYDGLDPTLVWLAGECENLRCDLAEICDLFVQTVGDFDPAAPHRIGLKLLEGVAKIRAVLAKVGAYGLPNEKMLSLELRLNRKLREAEQLAARCLGLKVDCLVDRRRISPGEDWHIAINFCNPNRIDLTGIEIQPEFARRLECKVVELEKGVSSGQFQATLPDKSVLTTPYWLEEPRFSYRYYWPRDERCTKSFADAPLYGRADVRIGSHQLSVSAPGVCREPAAAGFRELLPSIVPPISIEPRKTTEFLPLDSGEQILELPVSIRNEQAIGAATGRLRVETPKNWQAQPAEVELHLAKPGDTDLLQIQVRIPGDSRQGSYAIRFFVECNGVEYSVIVTPVRRAASGIPQQPDESNCDRETFITTPATVQVELMDLKLVPDLRYAYVAGAQDHILEACRNLNLDVHILSDDELGFIDLNQFDAIGVGPNAYLVRDVLRRNSNRLLDYVENGGTLFVQYQGYAFQGKGFAPFNFRYNQPHDRVTHQDAPVEFLQPNHFVLTSPNRITDRDFQKWTHDRGLYFWGEWDSQYLPLISCSDPGENSKHGGLVIAGYGQGAYIYSGYSFFRQLPAGVHGAFRLFANILAVPVIRIRQRMETLRPIELFSSLADEHLYEVAKIMEEHWYEPADVLCKEGEAGHQLFVIINGEVEILVGDSIVRVAGPGAVVGELAVLIDTPRTATLRCKDRVQTLVMDGERFKESLEQHPVMAIGVIEILAGKLADVTVAMQPNE